MVGDRSLTSQPAAQEAAARREEAPDVHECFLDVEVMKDRDHRDQIDRSSNLTQGVASMVTLAIPAHRADAASRIVESTSIPLTLSKCVANTASSSPRPHPTSSARPLASGSLVKIHGWKWSL